MIAIVSRFANNQAVARVKSKLVQEGLPLKRVLDKNLHANVDGLSPLWYLEKIQQDVCGLQPLASVLQRAGLRVVHPLERRLARMLWRKAGASPEWPRPVVVLRGPTRSGKDRWADAFSVANRM